MSADNIIIIAETEEGFSVTECGFSFLTDLSKEEKKDLLVDDEPFGDKSEAVEKAYEIMEGLPVVEYGINFINFTE